MSTGQLVQPAAGTAAAVAFTPTHLAACNGPQFIICSWSGFSQTHLCVSSFGETELDRGCRLLFASVMAPLEQKANMSMNPECFAAKRDVDVASKERRGEERSQFKETTQRALESGLIETCTVCLERLQKILSSSGSL